MEIFFMLSQQTRFHCLVCHSMGTPSTTWTLTTCTPLSEDSGDPSWHLFHWEVTMQEKFCCMRLKWVAATGSSIIFFLCCNGLLTDSYNGKQDFEHQISVYRSDKLDICIIECSSNVGSFNVFVVRHCSSILVCCTHTHLHRLTPCSWCTPLKVRCTEWALTLLPVAWQIC